MTADTAASVADAAAVGNTIDESPVFGAEVCVTFAISARFCACSARQRFTRMRVVSFPSLLRLYARADLARAAARRSALHSSEQ